MNPMEAFNNLSPDQQKQVVDLGLKTTEKLSNGIFKVLGYRLEAKHMKAMAEAEAFKVKTLADAKAYEIEKIGDAIRKNSDLPVAFHNDDNSLAVDITDGKQLVERSNLRLQYQQAKKEQNIESVIGKAVMELENRTTDSTEEVDEDWYTRFFNIVEDISDDEMQTLWSKILAGEVLKPRSYSLRLLELLKNISKDELDLILKIAPYVSADFIFHYEGMLEKNNITYSMILILDELGIINSDSFIQREFQLAPNETKKLIFFNETIICLANNVSQEHRNISIPIFKITEIGLKIFKLANINNNIDFLKENLTHLANDNKDISFSIYKILNIEDNKVSYDTNPIFKIN